MCDCDNVSVFDNDNKHGYSSVMTCILCMGHRQ